MNESEGEKDEEKKIQTQVNKYGERKRMNEWRKKMKRKSNWSL